MLYKLKKKKKNFKKRPAEWQILMKYNQTQVALACPNFQHWLHVFLKWQVCENEAQTLNKT